MTDLPTEAAALAELIRNRELSAVELTRHSLAVIAAKNPQLAAFVDVAEARAIRDAQRADATVRHGQSPLPAFLGVPTGIKDGDHMRGHFTRLGSRAMRWLYSPVDGMIARAMRLAGFTLLGKLATSELTILPIVDTALGPPTRNPLAPDRYAGGSSGGSAAAVASGMVSIAPGSDGAGSVRIPASFCGLVGFKPGRGVVPDPYEAFDTVRVSAVGPLARTVHDAALLLDALVGRAHLPRVPAPGSFLAACKPPPAPLRVRVVRASPLVAVDPEIDAAVTRAAAALAAYGHHLEDGTPLVGEIDEFIPIMARMVANVPILPGTERLLEPTTRWLRTIGKGVSRRAAQAAADALGAKVIAWCGDADVVLTPTVGQPPPTVGAFRGLDGEGVFRAVAPIGAFTAPFNASGQPAVSVPCGTTRAGLPIGVQLVGRRGADRELIGVAAALEEALR